jgi:hypothetical protein
METNNEIVGVQPLSGQKHDVVLPRNETSTEEMQTFESVVTAAEEEDEANEMLELSCNGCKCIFYDPNELIDHVNSNLCAVCDTPKILLSDHLGAVRN